MLFFGAGGGGIGPKWGRIVTKISARFTCLLYMINLTMAVET